PGETSSVRGPDRQGSCPRGRPSPPPRTSRVRHSPNSSEHRDRGPSASNAGGPQSSRRGEGSVTLTAFRSRTVEANLKRSVEGRSVNVGVWRGRAKREGARNEEL